MKPCNRCESWLPYTAFYRDRRNKDGRAGMCMDCQREAGRAWSRRHYVLKGTMTQPRDEFGRFMRLVYDLRAQRCNAEEIAAYVGLESLDVQRVMDGYETTTLKHGRKRPSPPARFAQGAHG